MFFELSGFELDLNFCSNPDILKYMFTTFAVISGIFVIVTKNPIISVFNLIVLYILVAFYLIYIGLTYIGLSYIIIYIGAIAILFLFIIMMIDVEVVEKRNNNYLILLFLLLGGFLFSLKNILYNIGIMKIKNILYKENEDYFFKTDINKLFMSDDVSWRVSNNQYNEKSIDLISLEDHVNYNKFTDFPLSDIKVSFSSEEKDISFTNNIEENNVANLKQKEEELTSELPILTSDIKKSILQNNGLNELKELKVTNPWREKSYFDEYWTVNWNFSKFLEGNNYLLIIPDWNSAVSRITQISNIGDVIFSIYHSFIYIISVILLLGMVGAIILTAENKRQTKIIYIEKHKKSSIITPFFIITYHIITLIKYIYLLILVQNKVIKVKEIIRIFINNNNKNKERLNNHINWNSILKLGGISSYYSGLVEDVIGSETILGSLIFFILGNIIIGLLLLSINYFFSLNLKYYDKGGGFECGFTSFVQTRERYNIIFYRVSLLFLVFDLEIILVLPYPAIYNKNQNTNKNNVLIFIYILFVGFVYELKEGALNIVKIKRSSEINMNELYTNLEKIQNNEIQINK